MYNYNKKLVSLYFKENLYLDIEQNNYYNIPIQGFSQAVIPTFSYLVSLLFIAWIPTSFKLTIFNILV